MVSAGHKFHPSSIASVYVPTTLCSNLYECGVDSSILAVSIDLNDPDEASNKPVLGIFQYTSNKWVIGMLYNIVFVLRLCISFKDRKVSILPPRILQVNICPKQGT